MRHIKFQFRLRTLMIVVLLAALVSVYEVEREYVAAWQKATMTIEVQFEVDNDSDGRADEVWTEYGDKRWEKVNVIWKQQANGQWRRVGIAFSRT
jgi:hypothetical protein